MNGSVVSRLLWARGLRAFVDGYISLLLPVYLISLGMGPFEVGVMATATLLGSGILTLLAGLYAWRFQYRTLLLLAALLMAVTGFGFAAVTSFWPLLVVAVVGTLNPSGGDVSVFLPLEHALLSTNVRDAQRMTVFARYSLVGSLIGAVGALSAGIPEFLALALHVNIKTTMQGAFALYGMLGLVAGLIYVPLPKTVPSQHEMQSGPLRKSKKIVYTLAALFSLDSFGGGFVVQSMVAMWLYQKFGLSTAVAGSTFFWSGILSAFSYVAAARLSDRFGLVNTMVFTHLPANILLALVPFMPSLAWAIALLLVRSALSQMDVPTRSSYIMAVVAPPERAAAASITAVPRSLASAISPTLSGYLLSASPFGWPLVAAGCLKITYDLLLLVICRKIRLPEGHE